LRESKKFLKKGGMIFIEFDPFQKKEIENILKKEKYLKFSFFKDQFKNFRFLKAMI
jgi:methylase of polypeptide subunit release factors